MTCICTCMQRARLLLLPLSAQKPLCPPFIRFCFQALPKGSLPVVRFAKALGRTMWYGGSREGVREREGESVYVCVCVGAEVTAAAPARDWSRSQSCAQTTVMLQEECGLMSSQSASGGLNLGQITLAENHFLATPFTLN